jgi:tetratricopeptide (TPR) repeat protein
MPKDIQKDPRKNFVPRFLPWLLGAAMFAVYFFTINPWLSLMNLFPVAQVAGYIWYPQIYGPLTWLATLPFHALPAAKIPLALNLFTAFCSALVLAILARCVAILPQDRTEPQRQREKSDFSFLTGWQSYFPPVLAVLMFGLSMTFWQNATNYTGEMVSVLLFAFIVWQVLEFRLDEKEWRLTAVALAYGAGLTETWGFVGFFPVLLAALIWLKKLEFFNIRFLVRVILCVLAGLLLFFLLPLVAKFTADFKVGIWETIKPNIKMDWEAVKSIKDSYKRIALAQAALSTVLPVLLIALRWSASFGDNSRIGTVFASNMFHLVSAAVFTVCVWVMFDSPFSPHYLLGTPSLTLYFLTALSIGYSCGYFLLVFTRAPVPTKRNPRPLPIFPQPLMWLSPVIAGGVLLCALVSVAMLMHKNRPVLRQTNDDTLLKFSRLTTDSLPKGGAILLCDSDTPGQNQPMRSVLMQAAVAHEGKAAIYPVLDTQSLNWLPYHKYVHRRFAATIPTFTNNAANGDQVTPLEIATMIGSLAKSNALAYLHPSYGYYFEQFYQEPQGLAYSLHEFATNALLPKPLTKEQIAANETFWTQAIAALGPSIEKAIVDSDVQQYKGDTAAGWLLMHLHSAPQANQNAIIVGRFCSRSLNDWGVQLQRAGELDKAAQRFKDARRLNPYNIIADINLAFNESLRAGGTPEINLSKVNADSFGVYRNWNTVMTANGPFDDISFVFETAFQYFQNGFFRQSAREFDRVRQLAPENLQARLQLAQINLIGRQADSALEAIRDPLTRPEKFGLNDDNSTGIHILAAAAHFQKDEVKDGVRILEAEIARHPDDDALRTATTQVYFQRGLFTNALRLIEAKLTTTPDDVTWLFGKGYASIQIGAYADSIKSMTRVLQLQTNNETALFNRALSYLQSEQLDKSRADYAALQATYANNYQIAYGLGEIAWRKKENAEALRNYQIYAANAPTNTLEFSTIRERLAQLRGK